MIEHGEEKKQEGKKSQQQVTDERYQTLFEQVNAAALLTTYEGQIVEANHKSGELLGYRWEELQRFSTLTEAPTPFLPILPILYQLVKKE